MLGSAQAAQSTPPSQTPELHPHWTRYEFIEPAMGVPFRIVLYAKNPAQAHAAARAAFQRIHQLDRIFSDYDDESEVTQLCRTAGTGKWVQVSPDFWDLLQWALRLSRQTDGAFDVTVGPYSNLWRRARRRREFPSKRWMERARKAVGYWKIRLRPESRSVLLEAPNMRLDFGAVAKGYAVDQALKELRRWGIHQALVAGAGDTRLTQPPPGRKFWVLRAPLPQTKRPTDPQPPNPAGKEFLCLKNVAVATSGDLYQYVILNGVRYSHIIDPRTGIGLTNHIQVNVIASDCTTADSLATTLCVLGPEKGIPFLQKYYPGVEARFWLWKKDRIELIETPGFAAYFCPTQKELPPQPAAETLPVGARK